MDKRVKNIFESIRENAGAEAYENIIKACGSLDDNATQKKQFQYVKCMLSEIENNYGSKFIAKIMKPCGHQYISNATINKAKATYKKSENLEDFLRLLNEQHIGGENLHIKGDKIIGIYNKCYCGFPKQIKGMSYEYCNCSAGWFEKLFSYVFEKNVEVKKIQTILEGSDKCVFEIKIS